MKYLQSETMAAIRQRAWSVFPAFILTSLLVAAGGLGWLSAADRLLYDIQLRLFPARPDPRVGLVCRDEATFEALGKRIPDRKEMAAALRNLWAKGPSLLVLDILLLAPSSDPRQDLALEEALSEADCILASSPAQGLEPLARFRARSVSVASIDLVTDRDGVLRSIPAPYLEPSPEGLRMGPRPLCLEAALAFAFPQGPPAPRVEDGGFVFGTLRFPARDGSFRIPFCGGDGTLPRIPLYDAIARPDRLPDLRGKVLLLGSTRVLEHDAFAVPVPPKMSLRGRFQERRTNTMAGIEIQGQALSAILRGKALVPLSARGRWAFLVLAALCAIALSALRLKPWASAALWASGALLLATAGLVFFRRGTVLPLFPLLAVWAGTAASSLFLGWYRDFRARRAVERLFGRYLSPNIARRLLENPDLVQLGGHRKTLTILESDIRGFTSLSEGLAPEQVTELLREYFTAMTEILFRHDGTLDKFIGDALLAFFGDPVDLPDHAERAVECAVAMQEEAARLRSRFAARGKPPLRIGVAVHTGPVVVGNHGSQSNFDYTVIGDTVNLTARLQDLARSDDVIVTRSTADLVPAFYDRYLSQDLESVRVKGKTELVAILSVVGRKSSREGEVAPISGKEDTP